ncbi:class II 3-deoxy-7-phosphoheptulonate synthase [Demequina lignilytica]|uniref:Phospho-2-dehydro-3-deoxyheptonate aldolase n=1 Tax=Demequina lignilytica TaxID=3051663 RepID=A0AAW7M0S5_9MICO|nr:MULTISPECIES: 3-deoxy-7-phosphoheptulonate synthase class II [unclassified Demequina]MDN4482150.1 3-deoxy-7-phosphoheptulonate synthase class II [Demequina sp. SYSU T0a273]MDN4486809.1 3-deoxy-7-phosphoheptulonate synthase class II [Demequina sp. SYSU T00039]MDN4489493.1 3-deoxy-7-phosphoheptulonate synthase class II [Demequina sp. SYSU T00068]
MTEAALTAAGIDSYLACEARQQPTWPDATALLHATDRLKQVPPLVFAGEADRLREQLAAASRGEAFVLQGGDCAEIFAEATADRIRNKIKTILQMAVILTYGASTPVVKIGRMAGQYAKPRSSDTETRDGVTLPAYRGDIVNSSGFTAEERIPDPNRLLDAYHVSASTLNLIRAFTQGGFADLRRVHQWNKGFAANPAYAQYERTAAEIDRAVRFMAAAGGDFDALKTVDLFSSHEALLLDYERALTRIDSRSGLAYDCSAHLLWIGERTRQLDGAHVEFLSKVHNPLAVKLGPTATADDAVALAERLNPANIAGRLTFVARMGADKVRDALPGIVEGVRDAGVAVTWLTDPMHGNTFTSESGYKTRDFDTILDEVTGFFEVHTALGTVPGGLHVELTGDDVTEVMGGTEKIDDEGLARRYETKVDPRLNHQQSLEMAFLVSELLTRHHATLPQDESVELG